MSIPESMKQITEAAEALVAATDVQEGFIMSEEQMRMQGQQIIFHSGTPDKTELILGDEFEIKVENGKSFVVRKGTCYPKTYEDCCNIVSRLWQARAEYNAAITCGIDTRAFCELLVCRNAYWKLAGDWRPNYDNDCNQKYIITTARNEIYKDVSVIFNYVLIFPTEKMRDAFYTNFKDLIETCKELI